MMICIKLFTDKRIWRRKYDNMTTRKRVHVWDNYGRFLDKKNCPSANLSKNSPEIKDSAGAAKTNKKPLEEANVFDARCDKCGHSTMEKPLWQSGKLITARGDAIAPSFDHNFCTEAGLNIVVDVTGGGRGSRCSKNEMIFRTKKNQKGHIIFRSYICAISVLLKNIAERLNNENFNPYENDGINEGIDALLFKKDQSEWHALTSETHVTETFIRNNFYLLVTPKKRSATIISGNKIANASDLINATDLNTVIDLSDCNQNYIDIRDDQEIHIRPFEFYVPLDIIFANDNGICGLWSPAPGVNCELNLCYVKTQRMDQPGVLYVKFNAINKKFHSIVIDDVNRVIQQICQGLALCNWYDYDLCFGKQLQSDNSKACLCPAASGHYFYSGWHCGIRTPLARSMKSGLFDSGEWSWFTSEIHLAGQIGKIDFFYWNLLFLRKRLCLYKNPLSEVRLQIKDLIGLCSASDIGGSLLDLCFDCWNFTNNLGEIICVLNRPGKVLNKKNTSKYDKQFFLSKVNEIINNQTVKFTEKSDNRLLGEYIHRVVECLLLRINEEFVAMSGQKVTNRIRLHHLFGDIDKKDSAFAGSVALRVASECWQSLRCSVRMIEIIKSSGQDKMHTFLINTDFGRGLIQCIEQQISANKLLFFSGLSSFSLTCLLSINRQMHLCILLQNGERLLACPFDRLHGCLDDNVSSHLYFKNNKIKSPGDAPSSRIFISALDERGQKSSVGKPIGEKVFKQKILIKFSVKKKALPKFFSASKVEYIALDTDETSAIGCRFRDGCIKRINFLDDNQPGRILTLRLEDADNRHDEKSQIDTLLDQIEWVNLRKKWLSTSFTTKTVQALAASSAEHRRRVEDGYAVPTSCKTIFDDDNKGLARQKLTENSAAEYLVKSQSVEKIPSLDDTSAEVNVDLANFLVETPEISNKPRGSRINKIRIDSTKRLLGYFENIYVTLGYIFKLIHLDDIGIDKMADNDCLRSRYYNNVRRLETAFDYLMQNHGEICYQKVIIENTMQLLDGISEMSTQLMSQKKYHTYEKVRQLLIGVMTTTDTK